MSTCIVWIDSQSQNIFCIFSTFEVSKLVKPEIEVKLEQPKNIFSIFITFGVLKLSKSRETNDEQLRKIFSILSTLVVVKVLGNWILSKEEQ